MTIETGCAGVRVAILTFMIVVNLGLVVVFMTINAAENSIVAAVRMTLRTRIPFVPVITAVDRKIHSIMIECGGCPSGLRMTLLTIIGKMG